MSKKAILHLDGHTKHGVIFRRGNTEVQFTEGVSYSMRLPSGLELIGRYLSTVCDAREHWLWVAVFEIEAVGDFNVTLGVHQNIVMHPDFSAVAVWVKRKC